MKHVSPITYSLLLLIIIQLAPPPVLGEKAKAQNQSVKSSVFSDIAIDPGLADQGELLYKQNCVFCHKEGGIGQPGYAPSLTNQEFLSIASNRFLVSTIKSGRPGTGMSPFGHLKDRQIKAIVAYLRSFQDKPSRIQQVENQPAAEGNPKRGKDLFNRICAACHGPKGNGYASGGTGTAIGKSGFLNKASDGFIRTTIKEGRSNTRMLGFYGPEGLANLTSHDIDDIISYLRTIPSQ